MEYLHVSWHVEMPVASVFAPYKGFQESLGFWIPCCGFRIPGTGLRIFTSRTWIPDSLNCIPDSKALDSEFHKQKSARFRNPDSLTWGDLSCLLDV